GFLGRENAHRAASGRKNWRLWGEMAGFNFFESLWEQWAFRWLAGLCWPRFLVRQAVVATVSAAGAARYSARWGKAEGMASLIRRTLVRTSAPIFKSLRRIVPHDARANWVWASPMRRKAQIKT